MELLPSVSLTAGGAVEYFKESGFTPNADLQVEGEVKVVTDITFAAAVASAKTIATTIKAFTAGPRGPTCLGAIARCAAAICGAIKGRGLAAEGGHRWFDGCGGRG